MKLWVSLLIVLFSACTKVEFEGEEVNLENLTIHTIETNLDIIDIQVGMGGFSQFYAAGNTGKFLPVELDVYNKDKKRLVDDLKTSVRIRGVGSSLFDLKSFEVVFDQVYNQSNYSFVENNGMQANHHLDQLENFRLRNSGQDFFHSFIKDRAYCKLAMILQLDFETMYGSKVYHTFVNGQYHGMLNARSESNLEGISQLMQVDKNDVVIYKVDNLNQNIEYQEGNFGLTVDLEDAIDNASPEELTKLIDISSLIDYLIFEDYVGNFDWADNNIRMYSKHGEPFRFILYDLDMAAFKPKETYLPRLEYQNYDIAKIYQKCRLVNGFDERLKARQQEIFAKVNPSLFNSIVDEYSSQIAQEIKFNIAKFSAPENYFYWMQSIDLLKHSFDERDRFVRRFYKID